MLDDLDRRILRQLQADPEAAQAELAERCGVPVARFNRRLERLRAEDYIRGFGLQIDWQALGFAVEVSLRVTLDKTQARAFDDFLSAARDIPEVIGVQTFLGVVDARLLVVARDMAHYQRIYREKILELPHIADLSALMHVATLKTDEALPL